MTKPVPMSVSFKAISLALLYAFFVLPIETLIYNPLNLVLGKRKKESVNVDDVLFVPIERFAYKKSFPVPEHYKYYCTDKQGNQFNFKQETKIDKTQVNIAYTVGFFDKKRLNIEII